MLLVIALMALTVFAIVRLVAVVRDDRSHTPPRSHAYELDAAELRLTGRL